MIISRLSLLRLIFRQTREDLQLLAPLRGNKLSPLLQFIKQNYLARKLP